MNKVYYLLLSASIFAACSSESKDYAPSEDNVVSVRPYINNITRAESATINNLKSYGFTMYAAATTADYTDEATTYINGRSVTFDGANGGWDYTPHQYWRSATPKVSFFAFSNPLSGAFLAPFYSDTEVDGPKINVTVNNDCAYQQDILAAKATNIQYDDNNGLVNFNFKHILSKIALKIVPQFALNDHLKMTINHLDFIYGSNLINQGEYYFMHNVWDLKTSTHTEGVSTSVIKYDTEVTDADNIDIYSSRPNSYLMLIPQKYATGDIKVSLRFTLTNYQDDGFGTLVETGAKTETITADLPALTNGWEAGKMYVYTLKVMTDAFPVVGDPDVSDWDDGSETPIVMND